METRMLTGTTEDIEEAGEIIRRGGLVAFPTETVYGLGADAFNSDAAAKVYAAKGRPSDNPMIVHIADFDDMAKVTAEGEALSSEIKTRMRKLADAFWPGPLTMVVPRNPEMPDVTTGGLDTVGVRLPRNETARALIKAAGTPIAAPSANVSGKPSPTAWEHVAEDMDGRVDAIIKGEQCDVGVESTVVDLTGEIPAILRPGAVTPEMIGAVLETDVIIDRGDAEKPKSPGMKYKHYAPRAEMIIYRGEHDAVLEALREDAVEIAFDRPCNVMILTFDGDTPEEAARKLFASLREADAEGIGVILAQAIPDTGIGIAVMDRMLRAAGFKVKDI